MTEILKARYTIYIFGSYLKEFKFKKFILIPYKSVITILMSHFERHIYMNQF